MKPGLSPKSISTIEQSLNKRKSSRTLALKIAAIRLYDLTKNNRLTAKKLRIERSNLSLWCCKMRDAIMNPAVTNLKK